MLLTRERWLAIIVIRRWVIVALGVFAVAATAAAEPPNVLFIQVNNLPGGMVGFAGHPTVKTPHLDKLAIESAYFTRCYTPTAEDGPSQGSLLTGEYPHSHGVTADGESLKRFVPALPEVFKRGEYSCGLVGAWSLPWTSPGRPGHGFEDYTAIDDVQWQWLNGAVWINGERSKTERYLTDWQGEQALAFIEKNHDRPFLLWVSFRAPHEPFDYPPGGEALYPPTTMPSSDEPLIENLPKQLRKAEAVTQFKTKQNELGRLRATYYAQVTRMDEQVGLLMQRLDELALSDQTIVVFVSSGGFALGEHQLFGKAPFFVDALIRVPLLIRYPQKIRGGMRIERVVSTVDLAPTLCALADLDTPLSMQGRSLLPLLNEDPAARHADEAFLVNQKLGKNDYPARGVVSAGYKYVDYLRDDDVLFDLTRDPSERHNVLKEPQYGGIIEVFKKRLTLWRKQTDDPVK